MKEQTVKPWYVVVERDEWDGSAWHGGDVVIGPFDTEEAARAHAEDSVDVLDWLTGEAKAQGYVGGDVTWTQEPEIPPHGVNAPVRTESEEAG